VTWKTVLVRGLAEGVAVGLLVGGVVALALGMWVLGPVLCGAAILALQVVEKARSID
jgi:hypothetical protein